MICIIQACLEEAERRLCDRHRAACPSWLLSELDAAWDRLDKHGGASAGAAMVSVEIEANRAIRSLECWKDTIDTRGVGVMRALSVRQPFAQALVLGVMDVINIEGEPPPVRGWIALHAGKQLYRFSDPHTRQPAKGAKAISRSVAHARVRLGKIWDGMPEWGDHRQDTPQARRGAVVGMVRIGEAASPLEVESRWADFKADACLTVTDAVSLDHPLDYQGRKGAFLIDTVTADKLWSVWCAQRMP